MRHLLIGASVLAIVLWPDFSDAQAGSFRTTRSLTGSGVPAVNAGYKKRYRSTYTSQRCANRDEIRELQRTWPETLWPKSMRCFPYR